MGIIVLGITIVILFIIFISTYNSFVKLKKRAMNSESGIDVFLQQRFDLIPNLVEVTKQYMNYERDILTKISELRSQYNNNKDTNALNELNKEYHHIMALAESYPDIKANEQFLKLQKGLIKIESQLQAARRIYNNDVTKYNTKLHSFPSNIIASLFGFTEMDLFELQGESEININF